MRLIRIDCRPDLMTGMGFNERVLVWVEDEKSLNYFIGDYLKVKSVYRDVGDVPVKGYEIKVQEPINVGDTFRRYPDYDHYYQVVSSDDGIEVFRIRRRDDIDGTH